MALPPADPPPDPPEIEFLEYEAVEEVWNEYELVEDVKIRGRLILAGLMRDKNAPPGNMAFKTHSVFIVMAPQSAKGTYTNLPQEELARRERDTVRILTYNEGWNVYRVKETGDTFKIKLVVTEAFRVRDVYDSNGDPYYELTHTPLVPPPTRRRNSLNP